jgi:hypothetical protein
MRTLICSSTKISDFPARSILWVAVVLLVLAPPGSARSAPPLQSPGEVQIPRQGDWTDHGIILSQGAPGSWDTRLEGAISPATMVKKNGTYFLYYIGADGNRSTDGGPRHRALGVATSNDGINFTRYRGNPVITHLPHNNQEEGVFSAAATLDSNGDIVLYYGALWAANSTTENVDIYFDLATSTDGLNFNNPPGYVRQNSGQEEDPVGVLRANGNWYVYFIDNQSGWDLKLMSSSVKDNLSSLTTLLTSGTNIIGGGDPAPIALDKVALFLVRDFNTWMVEVRTAPASAPHQLSAPVETYNFPNILHSMVYLDLESDTWFMYYLNGAGDGIGVKTAPATVVGGRTNCLSPRPTQLNRSLRSTSYNREKSWITILNNQVR